MGRIRVVMVVALVLRMMVACQSFGADTPGKPDASTPDATTPDAITPDAGAAEGSDAGVTNLFPTGDFETPSNGRCGDGWVPTNGNTQLSSTPHTGAHSCMVCAAEPSAFSLNTPVAAQASEGQSFHFRAFVQRVSSPAPAHAILVPRVDGQGVSGYDGPSTTAQLVTGTWEQVDVDFTVHDVVGGGVPAGATVDSFLDFDDLGSSDCVLVDDYQAWRTN